MTPLAVGPFLALVGIVAAFFVLRGKAKSRKSMYRTLRERREQDLRKARERATAAKGAAERTAIEREAAAQAASSAASSAAAAAAAAPPAEPAATATIQSPTESAPPAYTPPAPAFTPQEPAYSPPAPPAPQAAPETAPPAPVEPAPADVLPAAPPGAGDQTRPAWEIVQPEKAEAEVGAAGAGAASSKASWELDPREQQRMDEVYKRHGRPAEDEDEVVGEESLGQVLLSYAGLVLALLVILLGILFMIGAKATN